METMHVDCRTCTAPAEACADCVISVLLGVPENSPKDVTLEADEATALSNLAAAGLLPPLRLVEPVTVHWDADWNEPHAHLG